MNKKAFSIIIVVVVVLGGYLLISNKNSELEVNVNDDSNQEVVTEIKDTTEEQGEPEVLVSDLDTSNWHVYENEELGFSLKYPDDWKYVQEGDNFVNLNPSDQEPVHSRRVKIKVWSNPEKLALQHFYSNIDDSKKIEGNEGLRYDWYELSEKTKEISVGNEKMVNFISPMGINGHTTVTMVVDDKIIEINFQFVEEIVSNTVEASMVSSLKFF